jgi:hypothetical protein
MMDDGATKPGKGFSIKMRKDNARHGTKFFRNQIFMAAVVPLVYAQNFESCKE